MLGVRRLAAIAATNVVGYSGLIGLGQEGMPSGSKRIAARLIKRELKA